MQNVWIHRIRYHFSMNEKEFFEQILHVFHRAIHARQLNIKMWRNVRRIVFITFVILHLPPYFSDCFYSTRLGLIYKLQSRH